MPSTSPAQKRLMAAVAHGWHKPGGGGPSVAVAKEFNRADAAMNKNYSGSTQKFAEGGAVLGKTSDFFKTPDQFRDDRGNDTDENWGKGASGTKGDGGPAAPAAKGKQLKAVKPRS
jgi:hypothetical protein